MKLFSVKFRVSVTTIKPGEEKITNSELQELPIMGETADEAITTAKRNLFYSFVSSSGLTYPTYECDGVRVQCFFGSLRVVFSYTEFTAELKVNLSN